MMALTQQQVTVMSGMIQRWAADIEKKTHDTLRKAKEELMRGRGEPPRDVAKIMLDEVKRTATEMNMPPGFIEHIKVRHGPSGPEIYNDWTKPATKWEGEREIWKDFEYGTRDHFIAPRGADAGYSDALIWRTKPNREWFYPAIGPTGEKVAKSYDRSGNVHGSSGHNVSGIPGLRPMKTGIERARKRLGIV